MIGRGNTIDNVTEASDGTFIDFIHRFEEGYDGRIGGLLGL